MYSKAECHVQYSIVLWLDYLMKICIAISIAKSVSDGSIDTLSGLWNQVYSVLSANHPW